MKIRKTNKMHIIAIIVLLVTFLLVGCETNTTGQKQTITDGTEEKKINESSTTKLNNDELPNEKIDIYNHILEEYSDMVQNDFYIDLRDSDSYDSSFGENIGLEIRTHKQNVYYAFYDIDGNGTKELIIAGGENGVASPTFSP